MPERNQVTLELYDVRGMLVERRKLGEMDEGENSVSLFSQRRPSAGVYLYRLRLIDPSTGIERASLAGKTVLVK